MYFTKKLLFWGVKKLLTYGSKDGTVRTTYIESNLENDSIWFSLIANDLANHRVYGQVSDTRHDFLFGAVTLNPTKYWLIVSQTALSLLYEWTYLEKPVITRDGVTLMIIFFSSCIYIATLKQYKSWPVKIMLSGPCKPYFSVILLGIWFLHQ